MNSLLQFIVRPRTSSPYKYSTNNGAVMITGYSGVDRRLIIPSTIEGLPVNSIGYHAFRFCTQLVSITIPDSVIDIGSNAFEACRGLTTVTIGKSVASIGRGAFLSCSSQLTVHFKGNAPNVGAHAFDSVGMPTVYYLAGTTGWKPTLCGCRTLQWSLEEADQESQPGRTTEGRIVEMNQKEKRVLWIGVALVGLLLVFPPWKFTVTLPGIHTERPGPYSFVFNPPEVSIGGTKYDQGYWAVQLDVARLLLPVALIAIVTRALLFTMRNNGNKPTE